MADVLAVSGLSAGYGAVRVLHDLDLRLERGEILAVLGANGAGKSTLMQSLVGLMRPTGGSITLDGREVASWRPERIVREGLTLVPEGRRVFAKLTVDENLTMGAISRTDRVQTARRRSELLDLFPVLAERAGQRAGTLSGGEQQQLAICRALMSEPRVLLLDEPSLGLAPVIVEKVFELIVKLRDELGLTILLVEQSIRQALGIADRVHVMEHGRFTASDTAENMSRVHDLEASYLGRESPRDKDDE